MKDFIYLVQGSATQIKNYFDLANRTNADALFFTYDKEVEGATFFPHPKWATGRNEMLKKALALGNDYQYYIFLDDDVRFIKGDWQDFEDYLKCIKPAIGVPVVPKTKRIPIPFLSYQSFLINDEQLIAFHKDVIEDNLVIPYWDKFDKGRFMWPSCEIQEILIQNFYPFQSIQFNKIKIANNLHSRYEINETSHSLPGSGKVNFRIALRKWLGTQFIRPYKNTIDFSYPRKIINIPRILWRTLIFLWRYHLCKYTNHRVKPKTIDKLLHKDSEIRTRYNNVNL